MAISRDTGWEINPSVNPNDFIIRDLEKRGGFKTFTNISSYSTAITAAGGTGARFKIGDIIFLKINTSNP